MSLISLLAYPSSNATLSEFIILYKLTGRVILPIHPLFKKCLDSSCLFMFESTCHITHPLTLTHICIHMGEYTQRRATLHTYPHTHIHTIQTSNKERQKPTKTKKQLAFWLQIYLGLGDIVTTLAFCTWIWYISPFISFNKY